MPKVSSNSMTSIERALAILETLAHHRGLTNSDISRNLGIPKSSASYILQILESKGYLFRELDSGRYELTNKVVTLTLGTLDSSQLCRIAMPVMNRIVQQTRLVSCLLVLDGAEVQYVARVNTPTMRIEDWINPRMEAHATAGGKAIIAHLPRQEAEVVLSHFGLRRWTPNTITSSSRLFGELEQVRRLGFAIDKQEYVRGLHCVASPIFGHLGRIDACVAVAGEAEQLDDDAIAKVGKLLRESARMISKQLGARASHPIRKCPRRVGQACSSIG